MNGKKYETNKLFWKKKNTNTVYLSIKNYAESLQMHKKKKAYIKKKLCSKASYHIRQAIVAKCQY